MYFLECNIVIINYSFIRYQIKKLKQLNGREKEKDSYIVQLKNHINFKRRKYANSPIFKFIILLFFSQI